MTRTSSSPTTAARTGDGLVARLRTISLVRASFSLVWVALVSATSVTLVPADRPTAIAAVLLVAYPLWDAVATVVERRLAGPGASSTAGVVNTVLSLAAGAAMVVAVFSSIGSALLVFGVWAFLSGAIQLVVALRRRRTVGAQWPMIVSGGLSVLAGLAIALMSASGANGLSTVAGYSAFGAFWFIVSAVALTVRARRATPGA